MRGGVTKTEVKKIGRDVLENRADTGKEFASILRTMQNHCMILIRDK